MSTFIAGVRAEMNTSAFALVLGSVLVSLPAAAQTSTSSTAPAGPDKTARPGLTIGLGGPLFAAFEAQYRPRFTGDTGRDFAPGDKRAWIDHRARLGLRVGMDDGPEVVVRIQDVRVWGEETNTLDFSASGLDLHEAFAAFPLFDGVLQLRFGRQEIVLDAHRLVGNVGWTQRARAFDAVWAGLRKQAVDVDLFYAKVSEADGAPDGTVPMGRTQDTDFFGLHLTRNLGATHKVSLLYLFNGNYSVRNVRHTVGAFTDGSAAAWSYTLEAYFQGGEQAGETVSALLGAARIGYQLDVETKPKLSIFGDFVQGDGTPQGTFDTLYATNHKFYGEMDLFLNLLAHTLNRGLLDLGGSVALSPLERLKANVDFHHFRPVEGGSDGVFGNEIDVSFVLAVMDHVKARALYGLFLPGELMRARFMIDPNASLDAEHIVYCTLDVTL